MKKKTIFILAIITSLSLSGILITQAYWAATAFKLKEEQLDNSVRIVIKSVINQILQYNNDSIFQDRLAKLSCMEEHLTMYDYINKDVLDSLMRSELNCMNLGDNYYYGVYCKTSNKFILGNYKNQEKNLINSKYQFSLSSIYKPGSYYLTYYLPDKTHVLFHQMELWVFLSVLFLIVLIISFVFVIFTILHQKKISEVKTSFINNMTHEFKTPIAISSLAAEMIQKPMIIGDAEKIKKYATVILDENNKLQNQIEQVLQVAILESGKQHFKIRKTNIHDILNAVIESLELRIKEENATINYHAKANQTSIMGDNVHLVNLFFNLIDNAIKYSEISPVITIKTWNENDCIAISVKDNGIGISKEHQPYVFNNLYRVPTGNIHEVRGFGLGLYYVKTVVDELWGKIELNSEPGKGSEFILFFPTINKSKSYAIN